MQRLSHCPLCQTPILRTTPAPVAAFLREHAQLDAPVLGGLFDCDGCGFRGFVDRYEPREIEEIYRDYRGPKYFARRHHHEPWYTRARNDAIGGPLEVRRRRERLSRFLVAQRVAPPLRTALDWGGDRGQFIPELFEERHVFEISGVEPVPGVRRVDREELHRRRYDLVILAHVLEHASQPVELLREVSLVPARYLYVEVPFEPFHLTRFHRAAPYQRWVNAVAGTRLAPWLILATLASRVGLGWVPPFGLIHQHEHLNFFDQRTLARCLRAAGCDPIAEVAYPSREGSRTIEALGVLGRFPKERTEGR